MSIYCIFTDLISRLKDFLFSTWRLKDPKKCFSLSLFQGLKLEEAEENYEISAKPQETQKEEFTAPGTEIYNVFDNYDEEDFEYEDYEEEIDEKELRKKMAKELTEEEKNPQVEDPNLIKSEMIKLYGEEGADEILAMETAMQLRFEKARDASNAVIWPCLPLNMKFDWINSGVTFITVMSNFKTIQKEI